MGKTAMGILLAVFFALALLAGCGDDGGPAAPPANPNRIWVESQTASPGDTIQVEVRFRNAQALAGVQIPVKFSGTGFTVEAVVFGDSLPANFAAFSSVDCDPETARVNMIWTYNPITADFIVAREWLFATIEVCISPDAQAQQILVDKYSYVGTCLGITGMNEVGFVNAGMDVIEPSPEFQAGKITIVSP